MPTRRGDWWYYGRSFEGKQYGVQCRCPVGDPDDWTPPELDEHTEIPGEQILLDENVEAEGHDFFSLGAATVSLDGNILAFSVDVKGDERYTLRFKDLRTGELYDDKIVGIGAGATWAADNRTVYYVTVDDAWRPDTVWRHRLGAGLPAERVYHEPDERFWLAVGRTRSNKYVFIAAGSAVTSECATATPPTRRPFTSIRPRRELVEYSVEHAVVGGEDRFLILHNDGAENFTLVEAPVSDPTAFRTLIEHRDDVRLDAVDAFEGHLVVSYRSEALPRIQLWPIYADGNYGHPEDITFDSELMSAGLSANPNWSSPRLRVGATSFVIPVRIYDIELATGERTLLREQPVLGDYRPEEYVERRDWAVAPDGARVPISIIHRTGLQYPAPTLLYGYGAYESCEDPRFSIARLSLLDRGMVFAVAHVRGGGELGRPWYEHGKMLEKKNTFTDFIAVAAHLVDTDVTRPENLVAFGGSAGGLLMGAVANLAPDLFAGILAAGAVRRPTDHDPGPVAAADRHRVGRVGKPVGGHGRLPLHEVLLALRERRGQELSGDPGDDLAERHQGVLRRAGEMGCGAAACEGRRSPGVAQDRDERRPWWDQRTLRALEGSRVPVRVAAGCRQGQPRRQRRGRRPLRRSERLAATSSTSAGWASAPRRRWPGTSPASTRTGTPPRRRASAGRAARPRPPVRARR